MLSTIPDPAAFAYPAEVAALGRTVATPTSLDRALARSAGLNGLVRCFDPDYHLTGVTADRASISDWELQASTGSADPTSATINGKPALGFTKGASRALLASVDRAAGSFTAIVVREQSSGQAATAGSVMVGFGTSLGDLCHARQDGGMKFFGDTVGDKTVGTTRTNGAFIDVLTYDAATDTGRFLDESGISLGSDDFGSGPGLSLPMWIGGFQSGFGFDGKIGHVLIFDRDMSAAGNAAALSVTLGTLGDYYGL